MYVASFGFRASFNDFDELVLPDGRRFRKFQQPGGSSRIAEIEPVEDFTTYLEEDGDWTEVDGAEVRDWMDRSHPGNLSLSNPAWDEN